MQILSNTEFNTLSLPILSDKKRSVYISLTTIPTRFISDEFTKVINNLCQPGVDLIIIALAKTYKRTFEYDENIYKEKINNFEDDFKGKVKIIQTDDYGPGTKLLGLLEFNNTTPFLNNDDLIIVLDDDMYYSDNLVNIHRTAFLEYDCDFCACDQKMLKEWRTYVLHDKNELYYNNYITKLYGWLSFSFKYSVLSNLRTHYQELVTKYPTINYHDDLMFTLYCKIYKLKGIGTTIPTFKYYLAKTELDDLNNLRTNPLSSYPLRTKLEAHLFFVYKIREIDDYSFAIHRKYKMINQNVDDEVPYKCTFIYDNIYMITFTFLNEKRKKDINEIILKINDKSYPFSIDNTFNSTKITLAIKIEN